MNRPDAISPHAFHFENPFRPVWEYYATFTWLGAAVLCAVSVVASQYPARVFVLFGAFSLIMATFRGMEARRLYLHQKSLAGHPLAFMSRAELDDLCARREASGAPAGIFLGYGFVWSQEQRQLTHSMIRQDPALLIPPAESDIGQPWIHGIGMEREDEIWMPVDHASGHTLLVGTTRAGKTRMLDTLISQAVRRHECVVIWDPKGDRDLMLCAKAACEAVGRGSDFVYFHPAFPEKSWRIDPLANFSRATELATRVAALIPSETGADPFTAHSQMVLTNLCEGLLMINAKPTIALLKRYVTAGPEALVVKASEAFFEKTLPDWKEQCAPYLARIPRGAANDRERSLVYIQFYREVVQRIASHSGLEGLHADFEHDKQHQAKMTASLTPVLTMLTSGPLEDLLSPDPDKDDPRPISDFARIIRNDQVCYIGLDSLSDNMVGSAIGSMFVSDMTAVSGARYNYADLDTAKPVNLYIDEAAELVSDKMIQLLNKAGGAKLRLCIATQTFADFAARVGSAEKARQVLGNLNNIIALRIIDRDTQDYVAESLPKCYVRHIEYAQASDAKTTNLFDFGFRMTETMKETEVELVPPQMFTCLPNLEFFARVSGGRVIKGRIPILADRKDGKAAIQNEPPVVQKPAPAAPAPEPPIQDAPAGEAAP